MLRVVGKLLTHLMCCSMSESSSSVPSMPMLLDVEMMIPRCHLLDVIEMISDHASAVARSTADNYLLCPVGFGSQACQLMIGFFAFVKTFDLKVDRRELDGKPNLPCMQQVCFVFCSPGHHLVR